MSQPYSSNFLPLAPSAADTSSTILSQSNTRVSIKNPPKTPRPSHSISSLFHSKHNSLHTPSLHSLLTGSGSSSQTSLSRHSNRNLSLSHRFPLLLNSPQSSPEIYQMQNDTSSSTLSPTTELSLSATSLSSNQTQIDSGSSSVTSRASSSDVKETNFVNIEYDPVSGKKKLNTYEIIRELGRGQHGKVKLALNTETGEEVAIKIVERNGRPRLGRRSYTTNEEKIRREIAIMKKCNHPNIVRIKEVLDDSKSNKIYLVLEYLEKGEIIWTNEGAPVMSLDQIREVARDVVSGLEYLHFQGIIHRDIKPANLLRDKKGRVKISDFGVSYASSIGVSNSELELAKTAGTPAFFAPELCMCTADERDRPPIDHRIDIWALGVTIFCMAYGRVPFTAPNELQLFETIVSEPLSFDVDPNLSFSGHTDTVLNKDIPTNVSHDSTELNLLNDLIMKILEKDPKKRISIEEIKQHPWMVEGMDEEGLEIFLTTTKEEEKIYVTKEEVLSAIGLPGRIKRGLSRLGSHALHITGFRRKDSSNASSRSSSIDPESSRSSSRPPQSHRLELGNALNLLSNKSRTKSSSSFCSIDSCITEGALSPPKRFELDSNTGSGHNRTGSKASVYSNDPMPSSISRQTSRTDSVFSQDSTKESNSSSHPSRNNTLGRLPLSNNMLNISGLLKDDNEYDIQDVPEGVTPGQTEIFYEQTPGELPCQRVGKSYDKYAQLSPTSSSSSSSSSDDELRITVGPKGKFASAMALRETKLGRTDNELVEKLENLTVNKSRSLSVPQTENVEKYDRVSRRSIAVAEVQQGRINLELPDENVVYDSK